MDVSIIISIIALSFSVITYIIHDRKIKKQEKLINAYQIEKIEEEKNELKKAIIKANAFYNGKATTIKVFNTGKCVAKDIRFEILSECQGFFLDTNGIFPYEIMNPQDSTQLTLHSYIDCPDKIKIRLLWNDDFGLNNYIEQVLTI